MYFGGIIDAVASLQMSLHGFDPECANISNSRDILEDQDGDFRERQFARYYSRWRSNQHKKSLPIPIQWTENPPCLTNPVLVL